MPKETCVTCNIKVFVIDCLYRRKSILIPILITFRKLFLVDTVKIQTEGLSGESFSRIR